MSTTPPYGQSFADLYDVFHQEKNYAAEAVFIDNLVRKRCSGGRKTLREFACGTGNHAFEFEKLGYAVLATDLSSDMIDVAGRKAVALGSLVDFRVADMTAQEAISPEYDVAVCLFDSIGYLIDNRRILTALGNIRKCLRPGGVAVIESWHAGAMLSRHDPVRVRRWVLPAGELIRISESTCDHSQQLTTVRYEVISLGGGGRGETFREEHSNRYFLKKEMDLLMEVAGLSPVACYAGYSLSQTLTAETWHMVHVVEAAAPSAGPFVGKDAGSPTSP